MYPPQKWTSLFKGTWLEKRFQGEWWKKALIIGAFALSGLIFLPCVIPCVIRLVTSTVKVALENTSVVQQSFEKMSEEKAEQILLMKRNDPPPVAPRSQKKLDKQYQKWKKLYESYGSPVWANPN